MPWTKKKNDKGEFCVYKQDADGNPTGDSLGCHATEPEADAQIAALNINVEQSRNPLESLFEQIRQLFKPKQGHTIGDMIVDWQNGTVRWDGKERERVDRALSSQRLFAQIQVAMDAMQPQPTETGDMPPNAEWITPLDVYMDAGAMYLVSAKGGKLYRSDITVANDVVTLGEMKEVTESFPPVQQSISILRQSDGKIRWFAKAATAVLNRDGAIDSRRLFDSFVAHVERTKQYPVLDFWHNGEQIRMGQGDYVARDDAVYLVSGLFDDTELGRAAADGIEKEPDYWGTSISFRPTKPPEMVEVADSIRVPVYVEGINKYVSILPESRAASLFTTIGVQEVQRMKDEIRKALLKLVNGNEDLVKKIEEQIDGTNREIKEGGLVNRQAQPDKANQDKQPDKSGESQTVEIEESAIKEIVDRALSDENIVKVRDAVKQLETLVASLATALTEQKDEAKKAIDVLNARVEKLSKSDDEKHAEWIKDLPQQRVRIVSRPSQEHRADEADVTHRDVAEDTLAKMKTRGTGV